MPPKKERGATHPSFLATSKQSAGHQDFQTQRRAVTSAKLRRSNGVRKPPATLYARINNARSTCASPKVRLPAPHVVGTRAAEHQDRELRRATVRRKQGKHATREPFLKSKKYEMRQPLLAKNPDSERNPPPASQTSIVREKKLPHLTKTLNLNSASGAGKGRALTAARCRVAYPKIQRTAREKTISPTTLLRKPCI